VFRNVYEYITEYLEVEYGDNMIIELSKTLFSSFMFWFAIMVIAMTILIGDADAQGCNHHHHNLNGTHSVLEVEEVKKNELYWCKVLAPKYNAEMEVRQWDGVRVDLLNDEYAIEVDWEKKYAEGFGQAMLYGILTDRKPAVLLLCEKGGNPRYIYRAQTIAAAYGIKLYIEYVEKD